MKKKSFITLALAFIAIFVPMALTACGGGSEKGEVYIYSYGDYYDPEVISSFEKETGIKVIESTYDTAEEMYPVIKNNSAEYDVICTSDYMIEKMAGEGLLAEIDKANVANLANIDPMYLKKSESFDPGNKYSVPHTVGVAGIIYNEEMVGDTVIDSWADLWDPKFKDSIVMPDSVRDGFMIALRKLGYDQNATDENEIKAAAAELTAQKPLVYKYANDSARDLIAEGSAAIGVVWNGEYIYTKELNEKVKFVIPKEGTEFFIDSWCIPATSKNKANAEAFINYMCDAEVGKVNFDYLHYTTPNKATYELIEKQYKEDPAVFPSDEALTSSGTLKTLDGATTDLYSKYWKQFKAS